MAQPPPDGPERPVPDVPEVPDPVVQPLNQASDDVLVTETAAGALVSLFVDGLLRSCATASGPSVRLPAGALRPGDAVTAAQEHRGGSAVGQPVTVALDCPTSQFDNRRTGWNDFETDLTPSTVAAGFGRLFRIALDGQVYAQPLYASRLAVPGRGAVDVVFVATEADSIYALDADRPDAPPIWHRRLMPEGERPVWAWNPRRRPQDPSATMPAQPDIVCDNVSPQIGVTSTPVVDRSTGTLYAVAYTRDAGRRGRGGFHWRVHALDLATGRDRLPPVEISAASPGLGAGGEHGVVCFITRQHLNRAALLLNRRTLYAAFASHCDANPYHGWVVAYDADTLRQVGVFNATPDGARGGIWQSGCGPAADEDGNVYVVTGNGTCRVRGAGRDYGDSVVKLRPDLTVADFFTPRDQLALDLLDGDPGSGGPLLPPVQSAPPSRLLVAMGKSGVVYVLDRDALGGYAGWFGRDRAVQRIPGRWGPFLPLASPGLWGAPGYISVPEGQFVYLAGQGGRRNLLGFKLAGGRLSGVAATADAFPGEGGTTPTTSSSRGVAGSGIVWALTRGSTILLRAYRAHDLSRIGEWAAGPWNNPNGAPFNVPTVIAGRVYIGTGGDTTAPGYLTVFGRT